MINIIKSFTENKLLRDSAKLASSNILLYLLPFIVTPILSRLYHPYYFGEWGVFSSTYLIINSVLFLCYDYAIIKANDDDYPNVCGLSLFISLIIIGITGVVFIFGKTIGNDFFCDFPGGYNILLFLLFCSVSQILQIIANRQQRYWVMSFSSLVLGLSQASLRILFGIFVIFPNGLIAGTTIAQFINIIFLLIFIIGILKTNFFNKVSIRRIVNVAKKYKKFPLFDAPATLLVFTTANLCIIILSNYYSKSDIGCMSIIHQMLLLPISLIGGAMGRVYYRQITDQQIKCKEEEIAISEKMLKIVTLLSILPSLFVTLGGDHLINIFLGEKWENAGNVAICLVIWSIPNILTQPMMGIFRKKDKQKNMLWFNILNFVWGLGSLQVACMLNFDLYRALFIYASGSALANYIMFIYILHLSETCYRKIFNPIMCALQFLSLTLIIIRFISI